MVLDAVLLRLLRFLPLPCCGGLGVFVIGIFCTDRTVGQQPWQSGKGNFLNRPSASAAGWQGWAPSMVLLHCSPPPFCGWGDCPRHLKPWGWGRKTLTPWCTWSSTGLACGGEGSLEAGGLSYLAALAACRFKSLPLPAASCWFNCFTYIRQWFASHPGGVPVGAPRQACPAQPPKPAAACLRLHGFDASGLGLPPGYWSSF